MVCTVYRVMYTDGVLIDVCLSTCMFSWFPLISRTINQCQSESFWSIIHQCFDTCTGLWGAHMLLWQHSSQSTEERIETQCLLEVTICFSYRSQSQGKWDSSIFPTFQSVYQIFVCSVTQKELWSFFRRRKHAEMTANSLYHNNYFFKNHPKCAGFSHFVGPTIHIYIEVLHWDTRIILMHQAVSQWSRCWTCTEICSNCLRWTLRQKMLWRNVILQTNCRCVVASLFFSWLWLLRGTPSSRIAPLCQLKI